MRLLGDPEYRKIITETFKTAREAESNLYVEGVDEKGRDVVPLWIKNIGCGYLAIPVVGGVTAIINSVVVNHGYEHILPICAASLGLLVLAITTRFVKRKK